MAKSRRIDLALPYRMGTFMLARPRHRQDDSRNGQSLVEFALFLPVILILLMMGVDFGRVFLGWVNLNNTARIAANYAAAHAGKMAANDSATFDAYYTLIQNDAKAINCTLPPKASFPGPTFPDGGTALGQSANVGISCQFTIITPIISQVLGSPLTVSASADFPIRTGVVATPPGTGPAAPVAAFNISPTGGEAPVAITFTDVSTGSPTSYAWDFDGDSIPDWTTSNPPPFTYTIPGSYQATLTVSNGLVSTTATRTIDITPAPGPVANFTLTPQSGVAPLTVSFADTSTSADPIVSWAWTFGDGATSALQNPPDKTYAAGTWVVTLTVTDSLAQSTTAQKSVIVTPAAPTCTVPDFIGVNTAQKIQTTWSDAGFTSIVVFNPARPPEFKIGSQSLPANSTQLCSETLTVNK
jgi:PKD repeat protein